MNFRCVSILYSLVTLGQTVREMTAAPEAMKSEHSSMVFSSDSFTRFCISNIFIVIIKTLRTANHIVGFLACTYFRIHTCMYMYMYIYIYIYIYNIYIYISIYLYLYT